MTSRGVFPKTLAAPAIAPNSPVIKGLMALLGSSPRRQKKKKKKQKEFFVFFLLHFYLHQVVANVLTPLPLYQFLSEVMT